MPVKIIERKGWNGGGVVQFHNESARKLVVDVVIVMGDLGSRLADSNKDYVPRKMVTRLALEPNGMKEIGWVQGWSFELGDQITISHEDYKASTYVTQTASIPNVIIPPVH